MRAAILAAAALLPPAAQAVEFDALGRIREPFTPEPLNMSLRDNPPPFYVIATAHDLAPWILTPEPKTLEAARQCISWQVRGGERASDFKVCIFDAARGVFIAEDRSTYKVERGPYTVEAHERHMAEIRERAQ